jgi:hypothetical protein
LTIDEILRWADVYREATGHWPTASSGAIAGTIGETWDNCDNALRVGLRGLPGGSSLIQLLAERRGARNTKRLPRLTEERILAWADAHYQRTGSWPTADSGAIENTSGEKWVNVAGALHLGARGLPGGSSLARLLAEHRGVRNRKGLPPLTEEQILAWADAHHNRTGHWPRPHTGPILEAPGETWLAADMALRKGLRGFPGGSSLARLLTERRPVRKVQGRPALSVEQILAWADAHHERIGRWPNLNAGTIPEASGETWRDMDRALRRGLRGLAGGSSLAGLLARQRRVRTGIGIPRLSRRRIVAWAEAHHRRTGQWPTAQSGPIPEAPGETWPAVDAALRQGQRGLQGGSSLPRLLDEHGKKRNHLTLPRLSRRQIIAWADAHRKRTGKWPNLNSGPVVDCPGERWDRIDHSLRAGTRGLTGGSSLAQLLTRKRGKRNPSRLPPLTEEQILQWADLHHRKTGAWPRCASGVIAGSGGETWAGVDAALREGKRSLAGGSSLFQLLRQRRGR